MDDNQKEISRQLLRIESQLERVERKVNFISTVVVTVIATVLVITGLLMLVNFLGALVILGKPHYVFPAAVLGLFALVMLIKRMLRP